jgi:hypothetical protein
MLLTLIFIDSRNTFSHMKKEPPISRTCLACGLEKPLAAFLQLNGAHGTIYGNICSTCRSINAKNKMAQTPNEQDTGRSGTGVRVNAKTKVQTEILQQTIEKKIKVDDHEEKKKQEEITLEKTDTKEKKEKAEDRHRKEFIEPKQKKDFFAKKSPGAQKQKTFLSTQQTNTETFNTEAALEKDIKNTTVDTSNVFLDSQFGELKFHTEVYKRFMDGVLGEGSFLRRTERIYKKGGEQKKSQPEKNTLADHVRKNWKGRP